MRCFILVSIGLVLFGCNTSKPPGDSRRDKNAMDTPIAKRVEVKDFILSGPIRYENLSIFPVLSKVAKTDDRFITLDEGLKAGAVEVFEVGTDSPQGSSDLPPDSAQHAPQREDNHTHAADVEPAGQETGVNQQVAGPALQEEIEYSSDDPFGSLDEAVHVHESDGEVNHLHVTNRSDRPLYLMPGEIIVGGKQDRTIAQETIIPPSGKPVPIDVFCVEHGRWARRDAEETQTLLSGLDAFDEGDPAPDVADHATQTEQGKFTVSAGNLNKSTRLALQSSQKQTDVWADVAKVNAIAGNNSRSANYTANYVQGDIVKRLSPYLQKLENPVAGTEQIVGVIVAVNGKVEMMDIFESTPLFKKFWPKLLKSYALDAVTAKKDEDDKTCTITDAEQFLVEATSAEVKANETKGNVLLSKRSSERVVGFEGGLMGDIGGKTIGGMGGNLAPSVHGSFYSK